MRKHAPYLTNLLMGKEWKPIASAPANVELELNIYDKGKYYALTFPRRRDGIGWRDVRVNRPIVLEPTHWRPWDRKRP